MEVVILAAGLSQRMGDTNKLLIDVNGESMIRGAVRLYERLTDRIIVVLGYQADEVRAALQGFDLTFVRNANYTSGQQSSVRAGLEAAALEGEGLVVALGDQPHLEEQDIAGLFDFFRIRHPDRIIVPWFEGVRGNPIVIPAQIAQRMRNDNRSPACRRFIDANPDLVVRYRAPNDHFTQDIDTPADAAGLISKHSA